MSKHLGVQLYIKQDGYTASQPEACYGGNKVRKLEFLLAEALAYNAQEVITFGCTGSNHAVATASHAHRLGLKCRCFLTPQKNSHIVQKNLLLHETYGSTIHFYHTIALRRIGTLAYWYDCFQRDGIFAYVIPTGGSNALGALGFVNAAFELREQIKHGVLPVPNVIYCACGSKGTLAGLVVGLKLAGLDTQVVGVAVEKVELQEFRDSILSLSHKIIALLNKAGAHFDTAMISIDDICIKENYVGAGGYGVFTPEGQSALSTLQEHEHSTLDGVYTAKACAAMLDDCAQQENKNKVILFYNTYCSLDFDHLTKSMDYNNLPQSIQYFFETPVQLLDDIN